MATTRTLTRTLRESGALGWIALLAIIVLVVGGVFIFG